jgi:hypothetical protein
VHLRQTEHHIGPAQTRRSVCYIKKEGVLGSTRKRVTRPFALCHVASPAAQVPVDPREQVRLSSTALIIVKGHCRPSVARTQAGVEVSVAARARK